MKVGISATGYQAAARHVGWAAADGALGLGDVYDRGNQHGLELASGAMGVAHVFGFLANTNDASSSGDPSVKAAAQTRLVGHTLAAAGDFAAACGGGVTAAAVAIVGNLVNAASSLC